MSKELPSHATNQEPTKVRLTPRENQALEFHRQNLTQRRIAELMHMSRGGVHECLLNTQKKAGVASIGELRHLSLVIEDQKPGEKSVTPRYRRIRPRIEPSSPIPHVEKAVASPPPTQPNAESQKGETKSPFTPEQQQLLDLLAHHPKSNPIHRKEIAQILCNGDIAEAITLISELTITCRNINWPMTPDGFLQCYLAPTESFKQKYQRPKK